MYSSSSPLPPSFSPSSPSLEVPGEKHQSEATIGDNQMDIVRLLVAHSADLDIVDDSGATPRDLALQIDFYDCADLIDELKGEHRQSTLVVGGREGQRHTVYSGVPVSCSKWWPVEPSV